MMPYGPQKKADGRMNAGYIPINKPSDVDQIYETIAYPELRELLIGLIDSPFESWRCDADVDASPNHIFTPFQHSCFSFLTVAWRDPSKNRRTDHYATYQEFIAAGETANVSNKSFVQCFLTPFKWRTKLYSGFCLDIWVFGNGNTIDLARSCWAEGFATTPQALLQQ